VSVLGSVPRAFDAYVLDGVLPMADVTHGDGEACDCDHVHMPLAHDADRPDPPRAGRTVVPRPHPYIPLPPDTASLTSVSPVSCHTVPRGTQGSPIKPHSASPYEIPPEWDRPWS
jgi:hypothetical protein